ncbi:hypothetical protein Bphyt_0852 [Paraburkholderia phytofirmans PsJN]|uniref:Uncharacterized protein n=1 Tax=Paraburkholderia phytofirmans (strain DSM 17436 / LMG 22146 / PsJN) TaxID=398527 RepID=B2T0G9_PARPJ|nr:hypothetical protein Bphyt_0852 [Paraburkholderia phytofirmans PsJN]
MATDAMEESHVLILTTPLTFSVPTGERDKFPNENPPSHRY